MQTHRVWEVQRDHVERQRRAETGEEREPHVAAWLGLVALRSGRARRRRDTSGSGGLVAVLVCAQGFQRLQRLDARSAWVWAAPESVFRVAQRDTEEFLRVSELRPAAAAAAALTHLTPLKVSVCINGHHSDFRARDKNTELLQMNHMMLFIINSLKRTLSYLTGKQDCTSDSLINISTKLQLVLREAQKSGLSCRKTQALRAKRPWRLYSGQDWAAFWLVKCGWSLHSLYLSSCSKGGVK